MLGLNSNRYYETKCDKITKKVFDFLYIFPVYFFVDLTYNNIAGRNVLYTRVTELMLKRLIKSSVTRSAFGRTFCL